MQTTLHIFIFGILCCSFEGTWSVPRPLMKAVNSSHPDTELTKKTGDFAGGPLADYNGSFTFNKSALTNEHKSSIVKSALGNSFHANLGNHTVLKEISKNGEGTTVKISEDNFEIFSSKDVFLASSSSTSNLTNVPQEKNDTKTDQTTRIGSGGETTYIDEVTKRALIVTCGVMTVGGVLFILTPVLIRCTCDRKRRNVPRRSYRIADLSILD